MRQSGPGTGKPSEKSTPVSHSHERTEQRSFWLKYMEGKKELKGGAGLRVGQGPEAGACPRP